MNIKEQGYILDNELFFNSEEFILTHLISKKKINLGKKPSLLLKALIERQGEVYSVEEFIEVELENGRVITAASVTQYISKIRRSFRSVGFFQQVIQTATGDGYYLSKSVQVEVVNLQDEMDVEETFSATAETQGVMEIEQNTMEYIHRSNGKLLYLSELRSPRFLISGLMVACAVILLVNIFIYYQNKFNGAKINESIVQDLYPYHVSMGGCEYYLDVSSPDDKASAIAAVQKDRFFKCGRKKYKYITMYNNTPHYAYISCNVALNSQSPSKKCYSVMNFNYEK